MKQLEPEKPGGKWRRGQQAISFVLAAALAVSAAAAGTVIPVGAGGEAAVAYANIVGGLPPLIVWSDSSGRTFLKNPVTDTVYETWSDSSGRTFMKEIASGVVCQVHQDAYGHVFMDDNVAGVTYYLDDTATTTDPVTGAIHFLETEEAQQVTEWTDVNGHTFMKDPATGDVYEIWNSNGYTVMKNPAGTIFLLTTSGWTPIDGPGSPKEEWEAKIQAEKDAVNKAIEKARKDVQKVKPAIKSVKSKTKKKAVVTIKALTKAQKKKASGIQVQYALNKKFTKSVKAKAAKASVKTVTLKGLKSKKTVYVRVRAYKNVTRYNGTTARVYGPWSKVKAVKVK